MGSDWVSDLGLEVGWGLRRVSGRVWGAGVSVEITETRYGTGREERRKNSKKNREETLSWRSALGCFVFRSLSTFSVRFRAFEKKPEGNQGAAVGGSGVWWGCGFEMRPREQVCFVVYGID